MSHLFQPLQLRGARIRNRIWVSPMLQYSAVDGLPDAWHLVHLGALARGGAGVVMTEATAVCADGRITAEDTGMWSAAHVRAWRPITEFVRRRGAVPGIQLGHSGRKGSARPPWSIQPVRTDADGGWQPVGPSPLAFPGLREDVHELSRGEIAEVVASFADAASLSVDAGFDLIELHAAHGYLLHQFLSPLSNRRTDSYGGSFDNRSRLLLEVVDAVRASVPDHLPLVARLSATEWVEGGWETPDSVRLAGLLRDHGVDLLDVSTGGNVAHAPIPVGPGYQVEFARTLRKAGVPTGSVGVITEPKQAEEIVASGSADVVLLARTMLREPHWPLRAAHELGVSLEDGAAWPRQYQQAML